ncbi:glucose-6-phosphate dehydrogenase assembly protein OpcA, partial [Paenarthrobacter sp. NPDC056912]|uniref:glucose-6-phosphate dehydrogenase assembly protein OpcA n=1 Tax=Paenarthrobacter sp. NPDC056912 TaxID=3345965 RepID=UPI003670BDDF
RRALENIRATYKAGDTDLAWTRLTNWRMQLAAAVEYSDGAAITGVTVEGASDSPSTMLLATWLGHALQAPVTIVADPPGTGIRGVRLTSISGVIRLSRPGHTLAELTQPGQPAQRITLARRSLKDCLAEELRRLDPDDVFGDTVRSFGALAMQHETVDNHGNVDVDALVSALSRVDDALAKAG